jgi:hypothetical protein
VFSSIGACGLKGRPANPEVKFKSGGHRAGNGSRLMTGVSRSDDN